MGKNPKEDTRNLRLKQGRKPKSASLGTLTKKAREKGRCTLWPNKALCQLALEATNLGSIQSDSSERRLLGRGNRRTQNIFLKS